MKEKSLCGRMDFKMHFQFSVQKEAPLALSRGVAEAQLGIQTLRA
jgi:hypothetical protein